MKKLVIVNLSLLLIIFLTASVISSPESEEKQIENLMQKRIDILNDYYTGVLTYRYAEENLEGIEAEKLLKKDKQQMMEHSAEGFDRVKKSKIEISSFSKSSFGMIKGEATVNWTMESPSGNLTRQEAEYFFTGEIKGDEIKLTRIEVK